MTPPAWIALAALLLVNLTQVVSALVRYGMRKRDQERQAEDVNKLQTTIGDGVKRLEANIAERFDRAERANNIRMDKIEGRISELGALLSKETDYLRRRADRAANTLVNLHTRVEITERLAGLPIAPGARALMSDDNGDKG